VEKKAQMKFGFKKNKKVQNFTNQNLECVKSLNLAQKKLVYKNMVFITTKNFKILFPN
jgi:hypothetical protein